MREPADPAHPVRAPLPFEAALELPWLAPSAASLAALACPSPAAAWNHVRNDPGLILMILRPPAPAWKPASPLAAAECHDWFDRLRSQLQLPPCGLMASSTGPTQRIVHFSRCCAQVCQDLAAKHQLCHPNRAWVAGLLLPLGWLAMCAVAPEQVDGLLQPLSAGESWIERQCDQWGMRHAALVRRLGRAWDLPDWLTVILGSPGLQEQEIVARGAEPSLWHLLRVAVDLLREIGQDLGLVHPEEGRESLQRLGLTPAMVDLGWARNICQQASRDAMGWENPYHQPLLTQVLSLAGENRRLRDAPRQRRLEDEIDQLHDSLETHQQQKAMQLHRDKLEALAEFAAGAGHEINNPLAVVSGQAQYLLTHESTWFTEEGQPQVRKSLQTVIAQTRRVHSLLREIMLFARPAAPTLHWTDLPSLLAEVSAAHQDLAHQKRVRIDLQLGFDRLEVRMDAEQMRQALSCLLRNAIEAAPIEGWARLVLHHPAAADPIDVFVEDSGPGPDPLQRDHLFDPFFSGRNAGRGHGMGLPIAWRLARLQGGDVWLARGEPGQPTRFVLRLPSGDPQVLPIRLAS